jgi:hypothetical protein
MEYLGAQNDVLRDVRVEDQLKYQTVEEGLERPLLLQGAYARVATPGAEPKASLAVTGGFRRGELIRDFITGPRQTMYQLSRKYIIPASERVYVDGMQLTNGTDYTIVYTAGQLSFLNPESIDDLSVIWVEYEADLMPVKDLGSLSLIDMLPADNEVGTWVQTGGVSLITDQTGLYNRIDGGAPKYIDRGWVSSVYVNYSSGCPHHPGGHSRHGQRCECRGHLQLRQAFLVAAHQRTHLRGAGHGAVHRLCRVRLSHPFLHRAQHQREGRCLAYSIELFTNEIINRKTQAGSNMGNAFKQWMVAARAAASPVHGMEIGARVVEMQDLTAPSQQVLDANREAGARSFHHGLPVQKALPLHAGW